MLKALFSRRPPFDVQEAMRQAFSLQQRGDLDEAEQWCHKVLRGEPSHFDSLYLLGVIKLQQAKYAEAEGLFGEALRSDPASASALNNLGSAQLGLGRHENALASFDRALVIDPESTDAFVNRAAALQSLGRAAEALASYDKALTLRPDSVLALLGRANVLHALGQHDAAMAGYVQVLKIRPDHVDALSGIAHSLTVAGRVEEAIDAYGKAIAVRPGNAGLLNERANALHQMGRFAEALADADNALAVEPHSLAALISRGNALHALGRSEEALSDYDKAIDLAPDFAGGPFNRGIVLHALGRLDEAIAAYQWATGIKPDFLPALFNCAVLQSQQNRHAEALASYRQIVAIDPDYPHAAGNVALEQAHSCAWDGRAQIVAHVNESVALGKPVVVPHAFLAMSDNAEAQLRCARSLIALHHPASPYPRWTGEVYKHDRIRLAYLSADFHEHAVAFLIAGLLEQHDHRRFEVSGVVFGPDHPSPMRSRIEPTFDRVVDVRRKNDEEAADLLREMEIDIAIDLMGFTRHSRTNILACRPAPIQVNYLGYPGTMGAEYMDYIIADRFVIPEAQRRHYAESVVYLPGSLQVNDCKRRAAATPSRVAAGLPPEGFVFCAFNNSYKLTPDIFSIWMRLLQSVPGSVLWLIAGSPSVAENLRHEALDRGVAPSRLVFAPRLRYEEYLAQYRLADLFLDTLPYNGGATISDALWAGLPVVTCPGEAFGSRYGGSLLHAVGMSELISDSLADYELLALQLATDLPRLAAIRQKLAGNRDRCPLFDTDRFRRNIEAAYVTMWEKYQRGERPSSFAVHE